MMMSVYSKNSQSQNYDLDCNFIPKGFYREVASPLLLEVNLHYPDSMENSLTTNHFKQFFDGSEIVVAGQLKDSQADMFLVEVSAQMVRKSKII